MKPIFLPIFMLIFFPITFVSASTTDKALGADTPESQFLTNDEIAACHQLIDPKLAMWEGCDQLKMHAMLIPNGLHVYMTLNVKISDKDFHAMSQALTGPLVEIKVDPIKRHIERYFHPSQMRACLISGEFPL